MIVFAAQIHITLVFKKKKNNVAEQVKLPWYPTQAGKCGSSLEECSPILGFQNPYPQETRHHQEPARSDTPRLQLPELSDADHNPIGLKTLGRVLKNQIEFLKLKSQS